MLRYFADLPADEVATILDCPPGTVKSGTSRGLERLREALAPRTKAPSISRSSWAARAPGVTGATLRLRNGTRVTASLAHGWFLAWWPGTHGGTATDAMGTAARSRGGS